MRPPSRHAITFVLITVLLDMVGFGLIIPVLPELIEEVGEMDLADASIIGGWMFFAFPARSSPSPDDGQSERPLRAPAALAAGDLRPVRRLPVLAFAPSVFWLFVGRAIAGLCGSSYVNANAYIADVTAPRPRQSLRHDGGRLRHRLRRGPAIGGLLGEFGPRVALLRGAGISAANFIYGCFVLPETLPPGKAPPVRVAAGQSLRHAQGLSPVCRRAAALRGAGRVLHRLLGLSGDLGLLGHGQVRLERVDGGLTLAAYGIVSAVFQGGLSGPAVARFGEYRVALIGCAWPSSRRSAMVWWARWRA